MKGLKYARYAARWHLLNFQGQSYDEIAGGHGVSKAAVYATLETYRALNGFATPQEAADARVARAAPGLLAAERKVLGYVLHEFKAKRSTHLRAIVALSKRGGAEVNRVMRALSIKGYIDIRRDGDDYFALPLLDLEGQGCTDEGPPFVRGPDGVKRYTKAMYCQGYGFNQYVNMKSMGSMRDRTRTEGSS